MRVLVTRPQPGAGATARRLTALGHEAIVLPLTTTVALDPAPPALDRIDAVVATSAAAIRHANEALIASVRSLPLHPVGRATAQTARDAGFSDVAEPFADADSLVAGLPARVAAGSHILYLTGRLRTGTISTRLETAGLRVELLEIYDTVADDSAFTHAAASLGQDRLDAALVYSAYGAELLSRLAARPELAAHFAATLVICISARVAEALEGAVAASVRIAATPDEAAMLALLAPAA